MSIQDIPLYNEILELAKNNHYELKIVNLSITGASGYTETDTLNKKIVIGAKQDDPEYLDVLVHELLHAKLILTGYPKLFLHNTHEFGESPEKALLEIENIAHHILIYREMKQLGYQCRQIDNMYVQDVISDTDVTFDGGSKVNRALRIMEGYLRNQQVIEDHMPTIRIKQPEEYRLFLSFKSNYLNINTAFEMRTALVKVLNLTNDFVKRKENVDMYFNYLISIMPFFTQKQLEQKASTTLYFVRFNEYQETFLITREDQQCCYFVPPILLPIQNVDSMLNSMSLKEFLRLLVLPYKER